MEYFGVEFRRPGELITSVTTFGLDEDDALESALAIFDDFPEGDPRSYGDPLEVRIGTVAQELTFSTGWRKLQS
ncbi:hypothetical protein C7I55_19410 [Sphingomonas deserti]|uniref:Uncharacterized protein n=2 Tax=Allosphingosinicella deserti TaxID=2116704 RepID=A0A2P7QIV1_9SPHN|nr:hypothetical protein C7I55_19410 [Sphingomonas deserti]